MLRDNCRHIVFFLLFSPLLMLGQNGDDLMLQASTAAKERNLDRAIELFEQAGDAYRAAGDPSGVVASYKEKANSLVHNRRIDDALVAYEMYRDTAEAYGLTGEYIYALSAISEIQMMTGQYRDAIPYLREYAAAMQEAGDMDQYATRLSKLGGVYMRLDILDSASHYLYKAYEIKTRLDTVAAMQVTLNQLGMLEHRLGNFDKAIDYHLQNAELQHTKGDTANLALTYKNISDLLLDKGDPEIAKRYADDAYDLATLQDLRTTRASALLNLAQIGRAEGELDSALNFINNAITIFKASNIKPRLIYAWRLKASIDRDRQQPGLAEAAAREALDIAASVEDRYELMQCRILLGRVLMDNDPEDALITLEKAESHALQLSDEEALEHISRLLATLHLNAGSIESASQYLDTLVILKQSNFVNQESRLMQDLEAQYDSRKRNQEIAMLNAENAVKDLELRSTRQNQLVLGIGGVLLIALSLAVLRQLRLRRAQARTLADRNTILNKTLGERELLLHEVHHRVKSNLQIIGSLLSLQSKDIVDDAASAAINEGKSRVKSMALIHEDLYHNDGRSGVSMPKYIRQLARTLLDSYRTTHGEITLSTDIDPIVLDVDTVVPLGLIINEMLTNTMKYAFPDHQPGNVHVSLHEEDGFLRMQVADNGVGLQPGETAQGTSFGHKLIETFARKLGATLDIDGSDGTTITMDIRKFRKVA